VNTMSGDSTFRGDPIKTTFCGESLYADAFNLLRPSATDPVSFMSSYTLFGCGPLVMMRADASPTWQGLRASFLFERIAGTMAIYDNSELHGACKLQLGAGLSAFSEVVHLPTSSLNVKDLVEARIGFDYIGRGPIKSARARFSDTMEGSVGACFPLNKAFSLVVGADSIMSALEAVTIGLKFAPCHHFQLSLSDSIHWGDLSHRQTVSLYSEPRKGSMIGLLAAFGHKQAVEVALGFETSLKIRDGLPSMKLKSFLDADSNHRHEIIVPYGRSSIAFGVEMARMERKWTARLNIVC
jgi:hypothetical protein